MTLEYNEKKIFEMTFKSFQNRFNFIFSLRASLACCIMNAKFKFIPIFTKMYYENEYFF